MKIAIDDSPLTGRHNLAHRVRGTGFYIKNLKESLEKYKQNNSYIYFTQVQNIPNDVDIVHYPYFEPFFLSLPINTSKPTVVTVHDLTPLVFPEYFPSGIKGNIKWNIQKINLKRMSAIITDSESSRKDVIQFTGVSPKKVHVVYLAASTDFKPIKDKKNLDSVKKKYNLPDDFILYVGDGTWNKNLPRLMQAAIQSNTPLVMVGKAIAEEAFDTTNPWNQDLLMVAKLAKNEGKITRLGFIPDEDLIALYNLATLFIMPSLYEGFGLPLLEAMRCGCPVVTSREGSIPEVVGDAAYFVDAYSVVSISKGIKKVFSDKTLQENLRKKGIEQAELFTWEKTARETSAIYDSVLGGK